MRNLPIEAFFAEQDAQGRKIYNGDILALYTGQLLDGENLFIANYKGDKLWAIRPHLIRPIKLPAAGYGDMYVKFDFDELQNARPDTTGIIHIGEFQLIVGQAENFQAELARLAAIRDQLLNS